MADDGSNRETVFSVISTVQPFILFLGLFLLLLAGAVLFMGFPRLPLRRD